MTYDKIQNAHHIMIIHTNITQLDMHRTQNLQNSHGIQILVRLRGRENNTMIVYYCMSVRERKIEKTAARTRRRICEKQNVILL